jgi:arylsulfatase A-like enzyme
MTAPHGPAIPAIEDENLYPDLPPHRPPNFNEADVSDKPDSVNWRPLFDEAGIAGIEEFRRGQILSLLSADRAIEAIVQKLEESGELDNTVIIFLSDNGKHWGEHRLESKGTAYEESVRVPFALRYPPLVTEPYIENRLVNSVDIAPTFYDLARIPIPEHLDGESLVPLLAGGNWLREEIFIECWPSRGHWEAIHSGKYKYIETEGNRSEFYDLVKDPYELENQIDNPDYTEIIAQMKITLDERRGDYS